MHRPSAMSAALTQEPAPDTTLDRGSQPDPVRPISVRAIEDLNLTMCFVATKYSELTARWWQCSVFMDFYRHTLSFLANQAKGIFTFLTSITHQGTRAPCLHPWHRRTVTLCTFPSSPATPVVQPPSTNEPSSHLPIHLVMAPWGCSPSNTLGASLQSCCIPLPHPLSLGKI